MSMPLSLPSPCALDLETTGVARVDTADPRRASFVCAAIAPHGVVTFNKPKVAPGARIVVHNIPYDPVVLGVWDAEWDDTKVLAHLGGQPDTTLKGLQSRLLGRPVLQHDEAEERGVVPEYCLYDTINTWDLLPVLLDKLAPGPRTLYETLEKPLLPLWAKMTLEGSFRLDTKALLAYRGALAADVAGALADTEDLFPRGRTVDTCKKCGLLRERLEKGMKCGDGKNHAWEEAFASDLPLNINSPKQLLAALSHLGVKDTGVDTLRLVAHRDPAVKALLEYRTLHKELNTYIEPWCEVAQAGQLLGAVWRPTGAWTGRVSSAYPNLQNVPKPLERFFLAPVEGERLLTCDNAQLEVRIGAHISQDPQLMAACKATDLHGEMMQVFGFSDRRATKVGVFGTMYRGGPSVILQQAQKFGVAMTWKDAERMQAAVMSRMPDYFRWTDSVMGQEVVEGLFGRIHHIPLGSDDHMAREAVNCPIQGGAGDVCYTGDMRTLMADLTWKPLADVRVGDKLLAFDENPPRYWREARVLAVTERVRKVWRLYMADGTHLDVTPDHPMLTHSTGRRGWHPPERFNWSERRRTKLSRVAPVWNDDGSREAGWLEGFYDGEGCIQQSLRDRPGHRLSIEAAQVVGPTLARLKAVLTAKGFPFKARPLVRTGNRKPAEAIRLNGRFPDQLRFLGQIRPQRLLDKFFLPPNQRLQSFGVRVERRVKMNRHRVYNIETTTGTYIVEGFATHNCKYQMLALWRAGYHVVRQVHDSVTVSVPERDYGDALVEVPRIMESAAPPLDVPIKVEVQ